MGSSTRVCIRQGICFSLCTNMRLTAKYLGCFKGKGHLLWGPPVFLKVKKTREDGKIRMWIAGGPNISPLVRTSSTAQQSQHELF